VKVIGFSRSFAVVATANTNETYPPCSPPAPLTYHCILRG
jgi:hypothetical protein